jgi:hypothetical protein
MRVSVGLLVDLRQPKCAGIKCEPDNRTGRSVLAVAKRPNGGPGTVRRVAAIPFALDVTSSEQRKR